MIGNIYKKTVECRGMVFDKTDNIKTQIKNIVTLFMRPEKCGLFIAGHVGNGKSSVVKSISQTINTLIRSGYLYQSNGDLCYSEVVNAREMVRAYTSDFERFDDMKRRSWLIIDDLCEDPKEIVVYGTKWYPFLELLDYRYENRLPTILVSNLNSSKVKEHYGDPRFDDRFNEMFNRITFKDKSFRK